MVLNTNGLFQRSGLEQDTGLLKERWQQEGSSTVSAAPSYNNTSGTIHTVTAGKVFYLKHLSFSVNRTIEPGFLQDDGTTKINLVGDTNTGTMVYLVFETPIKFETDVEHIFSENNYGEGTWKYNVVGWEEDA